MAIPPFVTTPIAGVIPFDNLTNGFLAQDVQAAIEEAKNSPEDDNFSHRVIEESKTVFIKTGQQMLVDGPVFLDGSLILDGQVIDDDFVEPNNYSWTFIKKSTVQVIPFSQQMIVDGSIQVEGQLIVEGSLSIINDGHGESFLPPYLLESGRVFTVPRFREFFLSSDLFIEGKFINDGRMVVGG